MRIVKTNKKRKPYSERTDLQKIRSNWKKIDGLYSKDEWSSVIIRSATASEIAVNLMIREELVNKRELDENFVESLLRWANGIQGKIDRILRPLSVNSENPLVSKATKLKIRDINDERNSVVHQGQFKRKSTAKRIIKLSKEVIETLVNRYETDFELKDID